MNILQAFRRGDGAHRGLTDWYPGQEAALAAALLAHAPFDSGWYASKHEIASARIWSPDGQTLHVEATVSDDFDTEGIGSAVFSGDDAWTLDAVRAAVDQAWDQATGDQRDARPYQGFSILDAAGAWIETYLVSDGTYETPPGDNYHWWGWQHDEKDDEGVPNPRIPADAVQAFVAFAEAWTGESPAELTVSGWTIRPWKD
jgi:hypothetical protein